VTRRGHVRKASWEVFAGKNCGHLALSVRARLDIFPVNYCADWRTILLRTGSGPKLHELTQNEHVAFGLDAETPLEVWIVVTQGPATVLDSDPVLPGPRYRNAPGMGSYRNGRLRLSRSRDHPWPLIRTSPTDRTYLMETNLAFPSTTPDSPSSSTKAPFERHLRSSDPRPHELPTESRADTRGRRDASRARGCPNIPIGGILEHKSAVQPAGENEGVSL
jgi:hypothetical protein